MGGTFCAWSNGRHFVKMRAKYVEEMKQFWPAFTEECVALDGNKLLLLETGFVIYYPKTDGIWICQLFILPEYRRQKTASKAIDLIASMYPNKPIQLRCAPNNKNAMAFYEKIGFNQIDTDCNGFIIYERRAQNENV